MAFRERHNGEGYYTADETNNRNAQRGAFVREGGAVTVGASASAVVLNIDETDIRVDGTDYSASSGQVTLAENTTMRPRRDLVIARKGPTASDPAQYDALTGTPIDGDLLTRLQNSNQPEGPYVDDSGLPVHPPENIPHIQPPPFQGFRAEATLLAMVYVPPGTSDSTGLATEYITDLRMSGIGVDDVLRQGDVVPELEDYDTDANGAVDTRVDNSNQFSGRTLPELVGELGGTTVTKNGLAPGEEYIETVYIPEGRVMELHALGVVSRGGDTYNTLSAGIRAPGGVLEAPNITSEGLVTGEPISNSPGEAARQLVIKNDSSSSTPRDVTGRFGFRI